MSGPHRGFRITVLIGAIHWDGQIFGGHLHALLRIHNVDWPGTTSFAKRFAKSWNSARCIYSNDFSTGADTNWSKQNLSSTPTGGNQFLGQFGGGNNAYLNGRYTWVTGQSGTGSAVKLSSSGSGYISVGPDDTMQFGGSITVSIWVNFSSTPTTSMIVDDVPSSGDGGFRLGVSSGKLYFEMHDSSGNVYSNQSATGGTSLASGSWYQLTGQFGASTGTISTFVNDSLDRSATVSGTMDASFAQTFLIGRQRSPGTNFLDGTVDDFQVFNRALSTTEIGELPTGVSDGLQAYLKFDEGTSNRTFDSANSAGVKLTLSDLPAHSQLTVSFDLYIIETWDGRAGGNYGPDIWSLTEDGNTLLYTTFANGNTAGQSYPGTFPTSRYAKQTGASAVNTLGYLNGSTPSDSTYHLSYTFDHTDSSVVLNFFGAELENLSDESWGLDNVVVTSTPATAVNAAANVVSEGSPYTLNLFSGSTSTTGWSIDWGDASDVQSVTGDPSSVQHTYADDGDYTISALATFDEAPHPAASITATILNPPNAPSRLTATVISDSQINLTWQDNSNDESDFEIERMTVGSGWSQIATVEANVVNFSDTGLSEGTYYDYRIRASNASGDSDYSYYSYDGYIITQLKAPTNLSAAFISGGEVDLTYTNNASYPVIYSVEQSSDGTSWSQAYAFWDFSAEGNVSTEVAYVLLNPSTNCYFRIKSDNSGYSNIATLSTPAFPIAPSNLSAIANYDSPIDLTWTDNSDNETEFDIERSIENDGFWSQIATVGANVSNYADLDVTEGVVYNYRIRARNSGGYSAYSYFGGYAQPPYVTPTIVNPASAAESNVTGTTDTLSVLGAAGIYSESDLSYTWSVVSGPAANFSSNYSNDAKNTTVTFTAPGEYTFRADIYNGDGMSVSSEISVTVSLALNSIAISSASASVPENGTNQFTASGFDQFGSPINADLTWSVILGGGTIDTSGLYTAPADDGPATVEATFGTVSASTQIMVGGGDWYKIGISDYGIDSTDGDGIDGLSVSDPNWIYAATPQVAVTEVVSGTASHDGYTFNFPKDVVDSTQQRGFMISGLSSPDSRSGTIDMYDYDDVGFLENPYDIHWNVTVQAKPTFNSQPVPTDIPPGTDDAFGGIVGDPVSTGFHVNLYSTDSGGQKVSATDVTSQTYSIDVGSDGTISQVVDTLGSTWQISGSTATLTVPGPNQATSFDVTITATFDAPGVQTISLNGNAELNDPSGPATITMGCLSPGRQIKPPSAPGPISTPTAIYFINDPTVAFGQGHAAVIIPNGNGCTYYSYDDSNHVTTQNFNNITDALAAVKAGGYTREEHWNCTAQQASQAAAEAASFDGTKYVPTTHNCWYMVFDSLQTAGEKVDDFGASPNQNFDKNIDVGNPNGHSDL